MEERKLTPEEAAKRLGVHGDTVRRYIKRGIIRDVVKIGGLYKPRYLIPEREIERIQREAEAMGNDTPRLVVVSQATTSRGIHMLALPNSTANNTP